MSPKNSYVEMLMFNIMVLGEAFGRCLSHEGKPWWVGLVSLKETPQKSLTPSTMWAHSEKASTVNQEEGPYQKTAILAPWSLTFQSLEL